MIGNCPSCEIVELESCPGASLHILTTSATTQPIPTIAGGPPLCNSDGLAVGKAPPPSKGRGKKGRGGPKRWHKAFLGRMVPHGGFMEPPLINKEAIMSLPRPDEKALFFCLGWVGMKQQSSGDGYAPTKRSSSQNIHLSFLFHTCL